MKIIQTFWTGPASGRTGVNFFDSTGGWLSPEYHWMSWALSCLQLKKYFGNVELVTDEVGKKMLVDTLALPYSKVSTALEKTLDNYPSDLWSLAKIHSYSLQNEPFLHFDGDVFIWDHLEKGILSAGMVAQNIEKDLFFYREMLEEIHQHFTFIPSYLPCREALKDCIYASNAGIIGGHDISFIKKYCSEAFAFIDKNKACIGNTTSSGLNFIFEQCLLYYYSKSSGQQLTYFMPNEVDDPMYKEYVLFSDLPNVKMIHTVGGFKKMAYVCDHLARCLRKEYPFVYYRIVEACRQLKAETSIKVYQLPFFNAAIASATGWASFDVQEPADKSADDAREILLIPASTIVDCNGVIAFKRSRQLIDFTMPDVFKPGSRFEFEEYAEAFRKVLSSCVQHISDPKYVEMMNDLFNLECSKYSLALRLSNPACISSLYHNDVKAYSIVQQLFMQSRNTILKSCVSINDQIKILETGWNWSENAFVENRENIQEKLTEEKSIHLVALVPNILHLNIEEYYPDNMDMILMDIASEKKSVQEIVDEMREYFDNTSANDDENYLQLIMDAIKRLMYLGILRLSGNSYVNK